MPLLPQVQLQSPSKTLPTDDVPAPEAPKVNAELDLDHGQDRYDAPIKFSLFSSCKDADAPVVKHANADPCQHLGLSKSKIKLHMSWRDTAIGPAMDIRSGTVDIDKISPEQIKELTPSQRKTLMGILSRTTVRSERIRPDGSEMSAVQARIRKLTQPRKLNAASALLLKTVLSGDRTASLKAAAATPPEAIGILQKQPVVKQLVSGTGLKMMMSEMRKAAFGVEPENLPHDRAKPFQVMDASELDALGSLIHFALARGAQDKDLDLMTLVEVATALRDATDEHSVDDVGITMGLLISGLAKMHDQERGRDFGTKNSTGIAANQVWLMSGLVGGLTAGVVAFVAVSGAQVVANLKLGKKDYHEAASQLRNEVQTYWMQNPPAGWSQQDVHQALLWVRVVQDANSVKLN